ncbi:MAG: O-methyltransferase [Bacteroidales bacterium]
MIDRLTEEYVIKHSTPEDPVLEDLFRQTHIRFVNPNMASGHIQGRFLELITRMIRPGKVLEIGTYTGYSSICIARALDEEGHLYSVESNDEMIDFCQSYFEKASLTEKITLLAGRAQDIVPGMDHEFDMIYIDGDKREYCEYFDLVKDKLAKGGFIIADNVLWGGKALDPRTTDQQSKGIIEFNEKVIQEREFENIIIPLRDGINLIRKIC